MTVGLLFMYIYIYILHNFTSWVLEVRKTGLSAPCNEHNILVKPLHVCIWVVAVGSVVGIAGCFYMVQPSSLKSQQQPGQLPWAGQEEEGMQAGGRGIVRRIESKIKSNENKIQGEAKTTPDV